jgi:hypothetical protein
MDKKNLPVQLVALAVAVIAADAIKYKTKTLNSTLKMLRPGLA